MAYLGSLSGDGRILLDGQDIGPATYEIRVYKERTLPEALGQIEADGSLLRQVLGASGVVLQLEEGQTVRILVKQHDVLARRAEVRVTGPIPGF